MFLGSFHGAAHVSRIDMRYSLRSVEHQDRGLDSRPRYGCVSAFSVLCSPANEEALQWADPPSKESYQSIQMNHNFRSQY